jgi:pathogenesis-related protein 1
MRLAPTTALLLALAAACGSGNEADTPAVPASTPSPCTLDATACAFLLEHNRARTAATPAPSPPLPEMTWSTAAERAASSWAERCVWEHDPALGSLRLGQNLFASTFQPTPAQVVGNWVSEASSYDHAANRCAVNEVCGHYTQVVWRSSTGLGCATVRCTTGSPLPSSSVWWNVVCDYSPPGNFVGERPY